MPINNQFTETATEAPEVKFFTESRIKKPSGGGGEIVTPGAMRPRYMHLNSGRSQYIGKPTIENVQALLEFIGVRVEYNLINKRIRVCPLEQGDFAFKGVISDDSAIAYIVSKAEEYELNPKNIESYLEFIGTKNPVNPVKEWIESRPWDGKSRQRELFNSVTVAEDTGYRDELIRAWMAQAIAILYSDKPISARGVLVFQGLQHRGKTQWFKSLFPAPIDMYAKEGMSVDPNNRDSVMACLRYWAVELGELNGIFKKSDMESLKRFIGATSDVWRLSYAKMDREMSRTTVFYASVNDPIFLRDNENTRFWTVPIISCNERHGVDMQQIWAEILYLWKRGDASYQMTEFMLNYMGEKNKQFTVTSSIEEKILTSYDWDNPALKRWITATKIAEELGVKNPHHADLINIGRIVHNLGMPTRRIAGAKQICMPELKGGGA